MQVQVHEFPLCSRVVQVGEVQVQVQVHTFSLCSRVVQVGAGARILPVL